LLVPAGAVIAHQIGYAAAADAAGPAHASVGHEHLSVFGPASVAMAMAAVLSAVVLDRRGIRVRTGWRQLTAWQALAFVALEVGERLPLSTGAHAVAAAPTTWAGLVATVVTAWLLAALTRGALRVAAVWIHSPRRMRPLAPRPLQRRPPWTPLARRRRVTASSRLLRAPPPSSAAA
jgi:hypothetical protein